MIRLFEYLGEWNLMRAPGSFNGLAIDKFWAGPALWCAQDQHRPKGTLEFRWVSTGLARGLLDCRDAVEHGVEEGRHLLMHGLRIVPFECEWLVAVAPHEVFEFSVRTTR